MECVSCFVAAVSVVLESVSNILYSFAIALSVSLTRRLFVKMADIDNCLNYLLPVKCDSEIISSLRTAKEYPLICAKTMQLKNHSFFMYCLTINDSFDVMCVTVL